MIVSYEWDFGDGETGTGEFPVHEYAVSGTYTVTLTVTDDDGNTDTVSHDVSVHIAADTSTIVYRPHRPHRDRRTSVYVVT